MDALPGFPDDLVEPLSKLRSPPIDPRRLRPEGGVLPFDVRTSGGEKSLYVLSVHGLDRLQDDLDVLL
jgi:hypothetical protein